MPIVLQQLECIKVSDGILNISINLAMTEWLEIM